MIGYSAYSEGWATYVETYVGKYTEVESNLLLAYHLNDELSYTYLCLADIGINYYGWSFPKFKEFINQLYNFSDKEAEDIYYQLIEVATNYLEYYFGYYKLLDLKAKFMEASKNLNLKNSDYEFHKFYLETGPAPFYILEEELEIYLNQFKPNRKVRFFNENCPHSPNISTEVVLWKIFIVYNFIYFSRSSLGKIITTENLLDDSILQDEELIFTESDVCWEEAGDYYVDYFDPKIKTEIRKDIFIRNTEDLKAGLTFIRPTANLEIPGLKAKVIFPMVKRAFYLRSYLSSYLPCKLW